MMKVLKATPIPKKRNAAGTKYGAVSFNPKTLRRLPHVFSKVLELPLHSDADVSVVETADSLRFTATDSGGFSAGVRARTIEIHPGVTKTVITGGMVGDGDGFLVDDLDLNLWRFRLPAATRPELATAVCRGGELVVTIPKFVNFDGFVR